MMSSPGPLVTAECPLPGCSNTLDAGNTRNERGWSFEEDVNEALGGDHDCFRGDEELEETSSSLLRGNLRISVAQLDRRRGVRNDDHARVAVAVADHVEDDDDVRGRRLQLLT